MPRRDFLLILSGSALFVAIALSGGLFSYSPSSLPAAVSSLSSPSSSPLGSFTIQNAARVTPISITGFSISPPSLSALSVSGFNALSYSASDNLYRLTNPISLAPQASSALTLYLDPATTPSSLRGSRISLSSVSYQANNSNYTASASLSFAVPVLTPTNLGTDKSNVSSLSSSNKDLRDLATCAPTANACESDARSRVSNLINALDNKDNLSERSLITYVPDSPNAWRSVADNVRLGTPYEDIARALPDILRTQNISIPDSISALAAARSYACSTGLSDSRFLELQNLSLRRRQLELIKSRGYDLELRDGANNTSFLSTGLSACVRQPSYAGGTYEDVLYYLPTGECKTAVKAAATAALAATNSQIATARLRLFTDGFIDSSGLSSSTPRPAKADELANLRASINRCRAAADELDQNEVNSLRQLYGQACEDAKQVYPQFNHQIDTPTVKNIDLNAIISTTRTLDVSGKFCDLWVNTIRLNEQGERVTERICRREIQYPLSVNGVSCSGPQAMEQCGYRLIPIAIPSSPVPIGYVRFGQDTQYLGGACTGISNLVAYFFSNADYVGGDCTERLSELPNRLYNQCFEVRCGNFQQWFNTQVGAELNRFPLRTLFNSDRVSWEQVMDNVPDVCEYATSASDPNSITNQIRISSNITASEITNLNINSAFISPILSTNEVRQAFYNQHFNTLDDLIDNHVSTIDIILQGGAHQMFAYSCNTDTSINTFDPNLPDRPVVIQQNSLSGLWSVPTWTTQWQDEREDIINKCIREELSSVFSFSDTEAEARAECLVLWEEAKRVGNNIILNGNRVDYRPLVGLNSCR